LPDSWNRPVVDSVKLPANAQISGMMTCHGIATAAKDRGDRTFDHPTPSKQFLSVTPWSLVLTQIINHTLGWVYKQGTLSLYQSPQQKTLLPRYGRNGGKKR